MNLILYKFIKINFIDCLEGPKKAIKIICMESIFNLVNDIFKNMEFWVIVAHLSTDS